MTNEPVRKTGRLFGVGLGPGDPELVTVKAARLIAAADVVAYHAAGHGRSNARAIAAGYLREGQIEEALIYPVTTGTTDHPGGYQGAIDDFYAESAARLAAHLDAGRDVVVLAEGDPFFYGSYMHMHKRLAGRYHATVVPGVTSVSAASAVLGRPLMERDEVLTVLPGTLEPKDLAERLAATDSAAVMKLGRTFEGVREALTEAGRLDDAWYVERATTGRERSGPLRDVDPATVPYFSLALLPSPAATAFGSGAAAPAGFAEAPVDTTFNGTAAATAEPDGGLVSLEDANAAALTRFASGDDRGTGGVTVVGLGPGARHWLTPEAQEALAAADDLVGYGPYVDRVPPNPRQRRHSSDNRVEAERAAFALDLARRGRRVAVVSSGDPGVFAMAAAVLEVAEDPQWQDVPIRIIPGLTAAQAVASRAGAPLGHDFCILSLSDRLKPWSVIESRLEAAAAADLVIAVYNPASRSRREQLVRALELLRGHRRPGTPVVVGRDVGGPAESVRITTLAALDPATVDMRCLLIIGSSQTRAVTRGDGTTAVFTPRHYPA
ncbi:precorrin-3B C(17)-methyltransferase [Actinoplanes lobatus]|uniref:Precorrin-2 C20-methyltransferase/precorrin-3B C17-methyltransferase n=1 Tax=Actinoplanes lobatus TaxID=113568 RepID=A0A7W7H995_9ACTN|nr:precorrin-2 C(20)-methyltransferase [Actinoplanes lobatus]MBB4746360.1 precorrin-2 C20-methyltransferase/precorrin-3B C17-methyltransferase [Actinoplanes lobatus]GGN60479.1 precorrin-3B C(17)-methyltransferase [Actinoplanes lobatus]GIE41249.1 precorrin-3B C(17)-methyltransferase [Actinoplanes lobatus]